MSSLIKAGQAPRIRPIALSPARPAAPPARAAVELALDEARAEIASVQRQLTEQRKAGDRAAAEAYESGRADGRTAADDDTAERGTRLDAALQAAREDWTARLRGIDALAVHLARAVLAKLFANSDDLSDLVARAISHKLAVVEAQSVLALHVSELDFDEPEGRAALAAFCGRDVVFDSTLRAGECRIDLKLGQLDLGMATLAREADAVLAGLLDAEDPR